MEIEFHCASGSPYAWRVWLALEHKALAYDLKMLSFSAGDLQKPEFLVLNPRHKVPVIVDHGFALYESAAILEYLEDTYPDSGGRLFPPGAKSRALVRRLVREADEYLARALEAMVDEILFKPAAEWNGAAIAHARDTFAQELAHFECALNSDFLVEGAGAADFTLYPLIALALRMELRKPDLALRSAVGPKLGAWMQRVEALPYFARTYPPHWKSS
ncbi:glutathione S-transferase family protein [Undibacterium arcticum]|uniref:Glutathione S-transferase family protein n=1 Tax=Undibacterium arcticum TaxID=1762892 RepID=A0ABV7FB06_9BURK